MLNIAIIGSGRVAGGLAAKLSAAGRRVTIGARDPAAARASWKGPDIPFASVDAAILSAEVVVNATPGDSTLERFSPLRDALAGKILVDLANATRRGDDGMPGGLLYADASLAEALQKALPQTRVVKTLNTMLFTVMTDPQALGSAPTAFLSGDDPAAKAVVRDLLHDLGWPDGWIEDLGGIASARATEAMMLMVPFVLKARGFAPFALSLAH
jgi:predicted dinucleotide-binding enzyme